MKRRAQRWSWAGPPLVAIATDVLVGRTRLAVFGVVVAALALVAYRARPDPSRSVVRAVVAIAVCTILSTLIFLPVVQSRPNSWAIMAVALVAGAGYGFAPV